MRSRDFLEVPLDLQFDIKPLKFILSELKKLTTYLTKYIIIGWFKLYYIVIILNNLSLFLRFFV